jgi:hypothetical protein
VPEDVPLGQRYVAQRGLTFGSKHRRKVVPYFYVFHCCVLDTGIARINALLGGGPNLVWRHIRQHSRRSDSLDLVFQNQLPLGALSVAFRQRDLLFRREGVG